MRVAQRLLGTRGSCPKCGEFFTAEAKPAKQAAIDFPEWTPDPPGGVDEAVEAELHEPDELTPPVIPPVIVTEIARPERKRPRWLWPTVGGTGVVAALLALLLFASLTSDEVPSDDADSVTASPVVAAEPAPITASESSADNVIGSDHGVVIPEKTKEIIQQAIDLFETGTGRDWNATPRNIRFSTALLYSSKQHPECGHMLDPRQSVLAYHYRDTLDNVYDANGSEVDEIIDFPVSVSFGLAKVTESAVWVKQVNLLSSLPSSPP